MRPEGFDADDTTELGLADKNGEFHRIDDDGGTYTLMFGDPLPSKFHINARFSFTADMAVVDMEVIKARTRTF